ncbi:MAG: hypothetical protein U0931_32370 [Vulcanimicrobiota bacterium]
MAGGINNFNFNSQFNFQASFATSSFGASSVPYTGSNFGAYQMQQTAGGALSALGQLNFNYLDILGGGSNLNINTPFPGQPAPFASFNNVFVPSGAQPFASFNNAFVGSAAPFASFNDVFVPAGAQPFASFNNVFVPPSASPFASFNNVFVGSAGPFASFNNVFVPPSASPFASFGGPFPGQPPFAQGTGAIALFPATQFIPFGSFLG